MRLSHFPNAVTAEVDLGAGAWPVCRTYPGPEPNVSVEQWILHWKFVVPSRAKFGRHSGGVTLGQGISLGQAELIDRQNVAPSASSTRGETTGDWSRVPLEELERDCIAHLDAAGFRYYIPALMLSVLDHYDSSSMRVIGTLTGLYPKKDDSWNYHMHRYSLLNAPQKAAISRFLVELPKLVELDSADQRTAERALRNYWGE